MANKLTPIPATVQIKRIPTGKGNGYIPLRQLQREEERACELGYSGRVAMIQALRANAAKVRSEIEAYEADRKAFEALGIEVPV